MIQARKVLQEQDVQKKVTVIRHKQQQQKQTTLWKQQHEDDDKKRGSDILDVDAERNASNPLKVQGISTKTPRIQFVMDDEQLITKVAEENASDGTPLINRAKTWHDTFKTKFATIDEEYKKKSNSETKLPEIKGKSSSKSVVARRSTLSTSSIVSPITLNMTSPYLSNMTRKHSKAAQKFSVITAPIVVADRNAEALNKKLSMTAGPSYTGDRTPLVEEAHLAKSADRGVSSATDKMSARLPAHATGRRPLVSRDTVSTLPSSLSSGRRPSIVSLSTEELLATDKKTRKPIAMYPDEYDDDDTEYDNEEIMRKLRQAGIIKDYETFDFSMDGSVSRTQGEQLQSQSRSRNAKPIKVVRKPVTMEMLKQESADIDVKIKDFFLNLEKQKEQERQMELAKERAKKAKFEKEKEKPKPGWAWNRKPDNTESKKKTELFLSSRSRIMRDKWKQTAFKLFGAAKIARFKVAALASQSTVLAPTSAESYITSGQGQFTLTQGRASSNLSRPPALSFRTIAIMAQQKHTAHQDPDNNKYQAIQINNKRHGKYGPSNSWERAKRHGTTFKLGRMVDQLIAKKTTHQLLEYEKLKQQMSAQANPPEGATT